MRPFLVRFVVLILGLFLPALAHAQNTKIYQSKAAFLADTGATTATGAIPVAGRVVDVAVDPLGTYTLGSLTFGLTVGGDNIAVGAVLGVPDWYPDTPGINEIALGFERMQVTTAAPVFSFGFDFIEPDANTQTWGGVPEESTYEILLFDGPALVGQALIAGTSIPNDVQTFIGVWNDRPFNRVVINDTSGNDDDEYFGEFYTGTTAPGCTLNLGLSYTGGILTLNFDLATAVPVTWNAWLAFGTNSLVPLWSVPLPAVSPAVSFPIPFPFPSLGGIGILTTLNTAAGGVVCSSFKTIGT